MQIMMVIPPFSVPGLPTKRPSMCACGSRRTRPASSSGLGLTSIAGIGCVMPDGTIALNYAAPWAQRRGVGTGLLYRMEQAARNAGNTVCTLTSTTTARGFYLAHGYMEAGAPVPSFGGKPAFPMQRVID